VYECLFTQAILEKRINLYTRFIQSMGYFEKIGQQLIRPTDLAQTSLMNICSRCFWNIWIKFRGQKYEHKEVEYDLSVDI
jgi:hypothetical protein